MSEMQKDGRGWKWTRLAILEIVDAYEKPNATLKSVGNQYGVTPERVRQIYHKGKRIQRIEQSRSGQPCTEQTK